MKVDKRSKQFIWDRGNSDKNLVKRQVSPNNSGFLTSECEEVFFDEDKVIIKDALHSGEEERFILLGETKKDRLLFVVFTEREHKIRVISARDINKRERKLYEEAT